MHLIVNLQHYSDPPLVDDTGGTADIYSLGKDSLAKVFTEKIDKTESDWTIKWFNRQNKILALCNKYQRHVAEFGNSKFAFPESPAYQLSVNQTSLAGFSMKDFGKIPKIRQLRFDCANNAFREVNGSRMSDSTAIAFVYQFFESLDALHRARIILGDVSSGNVLFSPTLRHPVIIDIDSAQIASFPCTEVTPSFAAPELNARGRDVNGQYIFDAGTDVFAAAVVCFELLIGSPPHFVYVSPPKDASENRDLGVSSIRCFAMGTSYLSGLGLTYADVPQNKAIARRLEWLKGQDRTLYNFFVSVFVHNERNNLLTFLSVDDNRHPGYLFLVKPEFKKFADDLVLQRQKTLPAASAPIKAAPLASPVSIAHSNFRSFIENLTRVSSPKAKQSDKAPLNGGAVPDLHTDPPQLAVFMRQFNLSI